MGNGREKVTHGKDGPFSSSLFLVVCPTPNLKYIFPGISLESKYPISIQCSLGRWNSVCICLLWFLPLGNPTFRLVTTEIKLSLASCFIIYFRSDTVNIRQRHPSVQDLLLAVISRTLFPTHSRNQCFKTLPPSMAAVLNLWVMTPHRGPYQISRVSDSYDS